MDTNELLVRTMNAAKEAREKGFFETADAFDDILENLLVTLNPNAPFEREVPSKVPSVSHHMH